MTADTARRERALASVDEVPLDADMDWADAQETRSDYGLGFLIGYLAGSREEAAIKDAEIDALTEQTYHLGRKWAEEQSARAREHDEARAEIFALQTTANGLKQCCEEYRSEIAALREAVLWLNDNAESFPRIPDHVLARVIQSRRALEETP